MQTAGCDSGEQRPDVAPKGNARAVSHEQAAHQRHGITGQRDVLRSGEAPCERCGQGRTEYEPKIHDRGHVRQKQSAAALPFWVQNDVRVLAAGWGSAIQGIDGSTFKLHFDSNQQDALKPTQPLTIHRQAEGSEPDGITCG